MALIIFPAQFIKIISHYKKIGYNINVLQRTACLVVDSITVGNFAFLFNCTPVGRTSGSMVVPAWGLSVDEMVGAWCFGCLSGPPGLLDFFCSGVQFNLLLGPCPCFLSLLYLDLCVLGDDALIGWGVFHTGRISVCLGPYLGWGWGWRH